MKFCLCVGLALDLRCCAGHLAEETAAAAALLLGLGWGRSLLLGGRGCAGGGRCLAGLGGLLWRGGPGGGCCWALGRRGWAAGLARHCCLWMWCSVCRWKVFDLFC